MDPELDTKAVSTVVVDSKSNLPAIEQQAQALTSIAQSLNAISTFLTNGSLANLTQTVIRANGALGLLQSVINKDGFDVRRIKQYGIELTETVEKLLGKYQEKLSESSRDPEIHDAEADFNKNGS